MSTQRSPTGDSVLAMTNPWKFSSATAFSLLPFFMGGWISHVFMFWIPHVKIGSLSLSPYSKENISNSPKNSFCLLLFCTVDFFGFSHNPRWKRWQIPVLWKFSNNRYYWVIFTWISVEEKSRSSDQLTKYRTFFWIFRFFFMWGWF